MSAGSSYIPRRIRISSTRCSARSMSAFVVQFRSSASCRLITSPQAMSMPLLIAAADAAASQSMSHCVVILGGLHGLRWPWPS